MRHTTWVTDMTAKSVVRRAASLDELDVLELVRSGALPSYPLDLEPGAVSLPATEVDADAGSMLELTDREGVPVARLPIMQDASKAVAAGAPTWLATRSSRPFESWHRDPSDLDDITGVVVVDAVASIDEVRSAIDAAGPRPLLLALVSVDGDADPDRIAVALQLRDLAADSPRLRCAIAPMPQALGVLERTAVVEAYAHGMPTVSVAATDAPGTSQPQGVVLFFTGLSGSGKSTLARAVRDRLIEEGKRVTLLDGDVVRHHLSAGLGFSAADRDTNVQRIGWVAAEVAHHSGIAICAPIAPFEGSRARVRQLVRARGGRFVLVHVATPLEECERRDRKGLYARARRGEIPEFTGISSPYDEPESPDLRIDTTGRDESELVEAVLTLLPVSSA